MNPVLILTLTLSSTLGAISLACAVLNELLFAQLTLGGSCVIALLAATIDALQDHDKRQANRPLTDNERSLLQARRAARVRRER